MNPYFLTINFTAPPESMTLFENMTGEQIIDFLPITKEEMKQTGIKITLFKVERLGADGNIVTYPKCETVAEFL